MKNRNAWGHILGLMLVDLTDTHPVAWWVIHWIGAVYFTKHPEKADAISAILNRQPMNSEGVAVDDATSPCGLAQTTTPSGACPTEGCPQSGSSTTTGPEAPAPQSRSAHSRT